MAEQESNNTAVKIIAIIGGVIVVIVLSCGILGYFGIKAFKETVGKTLEGVQEMAQDMQQSQAVADKFVSDIWSNNLDEAYQATTEKFQKRLSRKEFEELVKKHPALKELPMSQGLDPNSPITPPTLGQGRPNSSPASRPAIPNTYRYRYHMQSKDGKDSIDVTIGLTKEDEEMKVDQLTVTQAPAGDKGPGP